MIDIYNRQQRLDVYCPSTISVVGVGGIGFYIAYNASLLGTKKLLLFDSDQIEPSNMNRLPYSFDDIGKNKAEACKEYISRLRPTITIFSYQNIDEWNLDALEGMVFICTDNALSQNLVRTYCVSKGIKFLRLGYDGRHFTIENKTTVREAWSDGTQTGYTIVPSYALTPQLVACLSFTLIDMLKDNIDMNIDISANIFHLGQALLKQISDSVPLEYADRRVSGIVS